MLRIKVLNPIEKDRPDFLMEQDVPQSHLVPTPRTKDDPRCPNRDAGTMVGQSYLDTWDGIPSWCPTGRPIGT